nr:hypothetical protein [Deltaproteobacteria bacterium]
MKPEHWAGWIALIVVMAFAFSTVAQEGAGNRIDRQTTVIDIEQDTIIGDLSRPDQEILGGRAQPRHPSLIRIREGFRTKVLQSVKDL